MDHEAKCLTCGGKLPRNQHGICPACSGTSKTIRVLVHDTMSVGDSYSFETRREFYEKNPCAMWVVIALTVISSLLGIFISGWAGVALGLAIGALSYFLGPRAIIKVREIERTHGQ